MDNIHYNFIDVEIPDFNPEFFGLWLSKVVEHYNVKLGQLSYVFCSDEELLSMNVKHLGHDYYTDIITFDYNEEDSLSGDLFISYDRVKENSWQFGNNDVFDELCRVMVHGLLHLIGYDDKSAGEAKEMRKQEELCLELR